MNQLTALGLRDSFNDECIFLAGVPNRVIALSNVVYACGDISTVKVKNFGNNNIISVVVNLKENGTVIATATANYIGE